MSEYKNIFKRNQNSSLWVSAGSNCIAFQNVPGYREIQLESEEALWDLVHQLVTTGFKVR